MQSKASLLELILDVAIIANKKTKVTTKLDENMIEPRQQPSNKTVFRLSDKNEEYYGLYANTPGIYNDQAVATFLKTLDRGLVVDTARNFAQFHDACLIIDSEF